jgi:hypothetical protein
LHKDGAVIEIDRRIEAIFHRVIVNYRAMRALRARPQRLVDNLDRNLLPALLPSIGSDEDFERAA